MDAADAAALLAAVSAFDGRHPAESTARAWASALPDVPLADALEYLPTFYRAATRDTKNWLMPGDVVAGVAEIQRKRVHTILVGTYTGLTGLDYLEVINGFVDRPENHDKAWRAAKEAREAALTTNTLAMSEQEAREAAHVKELASRRDPDTWAR